MYGTRAWSSARASSLRISVNTAKDPRQTDVYFDALERIGAGELAQLAGVLVHRVGQPQVGREVGRRQGYYRDQAGKAGLKKKTKR